MKRLAILILTATVSVPALACSPSKPTYFEDVAPGARNILVLRIESLELEPAPDELEWHDGDFKLSNKETTLRMQRELPPPEVPPPEGMCPTLVPCSDR